MRILEILFDDFNFDGKYIYVVALSPVKSNDPKDVQSIYRHVKDKKNVKLFIRTYEQTHNLYFGVCARKDKSKKLSGVECVKTVWVDLDNKKEIPNFILPPTAVVSSGNGLHCYWKLQDCYTDFEETTIVIKRLEAVLGGDSTSDVCRLLRIDGSTNFKPRDKSKGDFTTVTKPVEIKTENIGAVYDLKDISNACKVPKDDQVHALINGTSEKTFKSRSERDYHIIKILVGLFLSDRAIESIYNISPCGDKWRERGGDYLGRTIARCRKDSSITQDTIDAMPDNDSGFFEANNAYWKASKVKKGDNIITTKLSNFVFKSKYAVLDDGEYSLMCDVYTDDEVTEDFLLPREALHSTKQLKAVLKQFNWIWYGDEKDVTTLNQHISDILKTLSIKESIKKLGYLDGLWIGDNQALLGGCWTETEKADVVYRNKQKYISVMYNENNMPDSDDYIRKIISHLVNINAPGKIFPMLGWLCASLFKSRMARYNVPFPILNIHGTRGSGKTQTIFILQKLACYRKPITFDCLTTKFTLLTLLSSTQDVPISLSEYREDDPRIVRELNRLLLLLYDGGTQTRGRSDQGVNTYHLTTPLTLDGEDPASDPAILERCVQVQLSKTELNSIRQEHFRELNNLDLSVLGTKLIEYSINKDFHKYLTKAQGMCELQMSARVRSNVEVSIAGLLYFQEFLDSYGIDIKIDCSWFDSIVIDQETQTTAIDTFTTDIVNAISQQQMQRLPFAWKMDDKTGILWFQFSSTYSYWREKFSKYHMGSHSDKALKIQLKERSVKQGEIPEDLQDYIIATSNRRIKGNQYHCWGIHLKRAREFGLDITSSIKKTNGVKIKGLQESEGEE